MADDDLIIHLPDDVSGPLVDSALKTGPTERGGSKIDAPEDDLVEDLRGQMSVLKQQNITLQSGVAEATRRADMALRERDEARVNVTESNFETIVSGINAAKAEADAAEIALADAHERGAVKDIARAQRMLSEATSRIVPLEMAKAELEAERKARPTKPTQEEPVRAAPPPADPTEAALSRYTPKSQAWLREHPEFLEGAKNSKLLAAHYAAVADNIKAESPEYFEFVEQQLGLKQVTKTNKSEQQQDQPVIQRRPSAPSAPVVPTGGSLNGGAAQVRLSKGEVQSATDGTLVWNYDDPSGQKRFRKGDPIGVAEMARRKAAMTAEGQYDKTLTQ